MTPPVIVTTADNVRTIPYLGPLPQPSRTLGRLLQAAAVILGVLAAVRAYAYWELAGIEQRIAHGESGLAKPLKQAAELVDGLQQTVLLGSVVLVVIAAIWRAKRRPKDRLRTHGEAYVESPISVTIPLALRLVTMLFWFGGLLTLFITVPKNPTAGDLVNRHTGFVASSLAWAAGWFVYVTWIRVANRVFDERVAASAPYREAPHVVPFHTPITERAAARSRQPKR